jgi:hypothetical protein
LSEGSTVKALAHRHYMRTGVLLTKFYRCPKRIPDLAYKGEKKLRKITKKSFGGIAFLRVMWYNIPTPKNNTRLEFIP